MAVDAFLKLWAQGGKQIVGESSDENMNGAIEVLDFSIDCQSQSRSKKKKKKKNKDGTESDAEETEHTPKSMFGLKLSKNLDQSSPLLAQSYSVNRATV